VSMARRVAHLHQMALSVPLMTTVAWIRLSMYTSPVPLASTGISTMSSPPFANGMESSISLISGTRCWHGAWTVRGSQISSNKISLARLRMLSDIIFHSNGHGAPPNVSRSMIIPSSLSGSCVIVCIAVMAFRWHWR
jgi:hypothetical protein